MSKKEISEERKALYYGGMVVSGIGLLLFLSAFLSFMNPASMLMGSSPGSFMMRPFIGIIMIAAGDSCGPLPCVELRALEWCLIPKRQERTSVPGVLWQAES